MNTVIGSANNLASLIDRINTIVFQNYNTKLFDKKQYGRGLFLMVLKEGCRSRVLKASYPLIYNYLFLYFFQCY